MRFALLGDHPDGIDFAVALAASGRHQLLVYSGPAPAQQGLKRFELTPRTVGDVEDLLADPDIDAVIVASGSAIRAAHLRRALQSECHVLCVHPADPSPDVAYEAAMIQADTGRVLLPLLPMTFHPGVARFAELARQWPSSPTNSAAANASSSGIRYLELEIWSTEEVLLATGGEAERLCLPGWDVLRFVGGEIAEIFVQSEVAELQAGRACLATGRFQSGGLLQATYVPNQSRALFRLSLVTTTGRVTLLFDDGWPGSSQLTFTDENGEKRTEAWQALHPWPGMIERFEEAVAAAAEKKPLPGQTSEDCLTLASPHLSPRLGWLDELRGLELDAAARRSAERGRSSTLDLQEATEEASFKGTMTLVGCCLIWLSLLVLILAAWKPWLAWFILPVLGVFLLLQTLRWVLPSSGK